MILSATSRKGVLYPDLQTVQHPEHPPVNKKQEGPARSWLTRCSKHRACSCQQQAGRASQILTYRLFKIQSMLLSVTSRKGQPDPDLLAVQNPEHAPVSDKQEEPVRSWLTACSKHRACSCQHQARRTSQMLTYNLFKTQSMLLSATSKKGQPDADLHPVQNPEHTPVSNKQQGPARWWLTYCSKPRACSCQQQARMASQLLTYSLFKTQSIILSATCRKGQQDPDLQPVQNPEHPPVSNMQEGPAKSWLTGCSKPRASSCQQHAGRASQILTYFLFKTQSILLSATCRKGQPDPDLQAVQKPEHPPVSNMQEGPAIYWLTFCSKPRASCFSNKQQGPARSWLTYCLKPTASSCQQQAGRASQILTYKLYKTQSILLSATSRNSQPYADLHPVQNPEHALISNKQERPARCWLTFCLNISVYSKTR